MTEGECASAFEQLLVVLRSARMDWVVDQVLEHVRVGMPVEKEVSAARDLDSVLQGAPVKKQRRKRQATITFLSTRPFSAREQLLLLVDAVEQAAVFTARMEDEVLSALAAENHPSDVVEFRTEDGLIPVRTTK